MGARYQVIGNFSPGQFSFKTKREALAWAKRKRAEGFIARVSKIPRVVSPGERRRFKAHRKKFLS